MAGDGVSSSSASAVCPYDFESDGYRWPPLMSEADEMLQAALLMYPFTKLRTMIRSGKLKGNNLTRLLEVPLPILDVVHAIEDNAESLTERVGNEDVDMCRAALRGLYERQEMTDGGVETVLSYSSTLIAYGDENSEKELVYGVGIDSIKKRITVAFRGSVTQTDFLTDACIGMVSRPNPLHGSDPDQDEHVKIHSGFNEYLLKKNDKMGRSKFDEIMDHVLRLFGGRSDHKLYSTGHSLGGALSTLFAFEVASLGAGGVPVPVTCVSVASPKVGNESFRKANKLLEERGRLRHLRIANEGDPVTLGPPGSSKLMLLSLSPAALAVTSMVSNHVEDEIYKHVGVRLKLLSAGGGEHGYDDGGGKDAGGGGKKDAEKGRKDAERGGRDGGGQREKSVWKSWKLPLSKGSGDDDGDGDAKAEDKDEDESVEVVASDGPAATVVASPKGGGVFGNLGTFFSAAAGGGGGDTDKDEPKNDEDGGILGSRGGIRTRGVRYRFSDSTGHWRQDLFTPAAAATVSHHYGFEYSHRMLGLREDLRGMTLNELYRVRDDLE